MDWKILSPFKEQLENALNSASEVIPKHVVENAKRDCFFVTYDIEYEGRFIHHDNIEGIHIVIIIDKHLDDYWNKTQEIVRVILDELAHYELDQKENDLLKDEIDEAHKLARERFEKWLQINKEQKHAKKTRFCIDLSEDTISKLEKMACKKGVDIYKIIHELIEKEA